MDEIDLITIKQAGHGNEPAFKRLYDRYAPFVWKVAYRTVHGDSQTAEEIVQNTFVTVYGNLRKYKGNAAFSTWIYRIAFNNALQVLKRRSLWNKRHASMDESLASSTGADSFELRDQVERILDGLKPEERFLLTALSVDGMSFDELSLCTGSAPGTLRTRVHRIKQRIRDTCHEQTV